MNGLHPSSTIGNLPSHHGFTPCCPAFAGTARVRGAPQSAIDPSGKTMSAVVTPDASETPSAKLSGSTAMAGNTGMPIGRWHGRFVHVPMPLATRNRKHVDTTADLWMSVIEATGQPRSFS
jgi:hypothetical protein